jgi:hypothetical protein
VASGSVIRSPDAYQELADCRDVTRHGSLALDGYLPRAEVLDVARHLEDCDGCAAHVGQMAATAAVLGARLRTRQIGSAVAGPAGPAATGPQTFDQSQRVLAALARAADPEHADDLVQETWDHFLSATPAEVPGHDVLVEYLIQRVDDHRQQEDLTAGAWAESLLRHHSDNAADLAESDLPADPGGYGSFRELADLDALDPDADRAELLFPDLYSDGPEKGGLTSPPSAWPSVTRLLGPDAEVETSALYAVVDAAWTNCLRISATHCIWSTSKGIRSRRPAGCSTENPLGSNEISRGAAPCARTGVRLPRRPVTSSVLRID